MKKFYSFIALASMMLTSVLSFTSCQKDEMPSPAEDIAKAAYDIAKTVDNSSKASDLETYWEGYAAYGSTAMRVYLKFDVTAYGFGQGREICKIKGEDKVYSDRKFDFSVKDGVLTLTYKDNGTSVVISKDNWSINNQGSYENKLYATFTYNGQTVTWNKLSKMSYWSDTSLLQFF